ncbi:oligosaccharide flippase family protein [Vibrio sp. AK197]
MIGNILKWQTMSKAFIFFISMGQVAILARLLELSDFGVVAIVMVVINISQILADLGMANYLVHKQKVSSVLNSTVFWFCASSGLLLFLFLCAITPLVANMYDNSEILSLLPFAALTFVPLSLSAQLQARYVCDFKLNLLAKFDMISRFAGTVLTVSTAYFGMGAASIFFGSVFTSFVRCFLIWGYADKSWYPKFSFSMEEAKGAWRYGIYQIGSQLINQFILNLDTLLLGFYISSNQLGAFNLAKQLTRKPSEFILPIARSISLPLFASSQKDMGKMNEIARKAHTYVSAVLIFPYAIMCMLNEELISFVYGDGKLEVAYFMVPLAIFWGVRSVGGALVGTLTQGLGKTKIDFYWNLSVLGLFGVMYSVLARYGAYNLAWGSAVLQTLLLNVVFLVFYKRIINFKYSWYITPIITFLVISVGSIFISEYFVSYASLIHSNFVYLTLISIISIGIYYMGYYVTHNSSAPVPTPMGLINKKKKLG